MKRLCALTLPILVGACGITSPQPKAPPEVTKPSVAAEVPAPTAPEPVEPAPPPSKPAIASEPAKAPPRPPAARPAPPVVAAAPTPAPAPRPAPPPLDLKSLEQRLKDTSAIGVLTKLSLKNQVDDLVARFKAFHDGRRPPALTDLRPAFELLLMKVLSLLQDKDAALANDINASREAIWRVLSDREKLSQYL